MTVRNFTWFLMGALLVLASAASALAEEQKRPFFYRIEKDGKSSFILGSMHGGIPLDSFPAEIQKQFAQATTVAFEGDREAFREKYGAQLKAGAEYSQGDGLSRHLDEASLAKLESILGPNADAKALDHYRPWAIEDAILDIAKSRLKSQSGVSWSFDDGIDHTLLTRAKAEGRRTEFLDDPSTKVASFDANFTAADLQRLLRYPDPVKHLADCANLARGAYLAGDAQGVEAYLQNDCETPGSVEEMYRRSESWIPHLKEMFDRGNAFVVFGAGHLYGPRGVLTLLEKAGYKVTRLAPLQDSPEAAPAKLGFPRAVPAAPALH